MLKNSRMHVHVSLFPHTHMQACTHTLLPKYKLGSIISLHTQKLFGQSYNNNNTENSYFSTLLNFTTKGGLFSYFKLILLHWDYQ